MKVRTWMAVGALALGLSAPVVADAATYISNYNGTTFTVTTIGTNEFTLDIKNPTAGWSSAQDLGAFAFNDIGATGTLTAKEIAPGVELATTMAGGLNSGACDGSGSGWTCFSFSSSPIAVASDMTFDIKTTGNFNFKSTGPDLKIQFLAEKFDHKANKYVLDKTGDLFSQSIPLCTTGICATGNGGGDGVPEPAAWALMITGVFSVGAALRQRRSRALAAA